MERFFKIFPLIGESELGLEKFCSFLSCQITETAEKNFSLMLQTDKSEKRWSIIFADALILLFEKVARMIEAYQPLIETYYGYGNMFSFVKNIYPTFKWEQSKFKKYGYSIKQIEWLNKLSEQLNICIKHKLNEGEFRLPENLRFSVDGYYKHDDYSEIENILDLLISSYHINKNLKSNEIIFEFHGCFWHGCPSCFPNRDQMNKITNKTYKEMYNKTLKKKEFCILSGYNYIEIWECEYEKLNN